MTFLSAEESSHYVNGLLATCQNPEVVESLIESIILFFYTLCFNQYLLH